MRHTSYWATLLVGAAAAAVLQAGTTSLEPLPKSQWDRDKAAHLLRRAGFGGTPDEIDRLTKLGMAAAVDYLVDYHEVPFSIAPPAMDPLISEPVDRNALRDLSEEDRRAYRQRRQRAERESHIETRLWWIDCMVTSPRPFEEKMTLFWHGRLTSGAREVKRAMFMLEQNEFLRKNALTSFDELLLGISKDRAMLLYLDNVRNVKRQPNENYARELLELFTLGVGHYTENDIKAAARAFTGWGFDDEGFAFHRALHDDGEKTFLGKTGDLDGNDIIDTIVAQQACSEHLAQKLLEFYVCPDPSKALVRRLAAEIRKEKFRLRFVMKTLFCSKAFYDGDVRGSLVKSPTELLIGTARQLGLPINKLFEAERALVGMGQELMQPPNVKGWDGGEKWINTATLYNRYNTVSALIAGDGRAPRGKEGSTPSDTMDDGMAGAMKPREGRSPMMSAEMSPKSRRHGGWQPPYDPMPTVKRYELETPEQIVAFYVKQLLAVPLDPAKQDALVAYLSKGGTFRVDDKEAAQQIRTMIQLLCSTPEYQMN